MSWFDTIKQVGNMTPEEMDAEISRIQGGNLGQPAKCPSCGSIKTRSNKFGQKGGVVQQKCSDCGHTWKRSG